MAEVFILRSRFPSIQSNQDFIRPARETVYGLFPGIRTTNSTMLSLCSALQNFGGIAPTVTWAVATAITV